MSSEKLIPLSEFITLQRGFDLPQSERRIGNVPIIASNGVVGSHSEVKVKAPGVVIGRSGSIGGGQYVCEDFWPLNTTLYVKDFKGHDPRFVYYLMRSIDFARFNVGSGVPTLNRNHLVSVNVRNLSVETEKKVSKVLGILDDKIELNRQTNHTLEQIAQALFKSWFVDFEPTRAKIAAKEAGASSEEIERAAMCAISGKTPDQLAQLPPEIQQNLKTTAALFPDALMDSELGEIPVGWEVKQLSEVGNIVCGKTPPKDNPEYYDGEFPFIKIPDMHGKVYATKTSDTLTHLGANTQIKKLLPKDSVCVSCIATVGLVSLTCADSFTNQQINTIIPNDKNYSQYLYFAMLGLNDHLHDLASGGSATLNLNTGYFSKIKIVFPDKGSLENFSNQVMPIFDLILKQSLEIDSLERIRDSLLPKLFSGEIEAYGAMNCAAWDS